jgi:hypothetical protein
MSKWHVFIALVVIFNVAVSGGFILASNYLFDYLNTEMGDIGYTDQGLYSIPYIVFSGFQVQISHEMYENGQSVNLGPLPTVIPNYPYILFWVSTLGNLGLMALALILHKTKFSRILKRNRETS